MFLWRIAKGDKEVRAPLPLLSHFREGIRDVESEAAHIEPFIR